MDAAMQSEETAMAASTGHPDSASGADAADRAGTTIAPLGTSAGADGPVDSVDSLPAGAPDWDRSNDRRLIRAMHVRRGLDPGGRIPGLRTAARVMVVISIAGLAVTAAASWTSWRLDHTGEHRLLQLQTRQAANVVSAAITGVVSPLQTALAVSTVTNGDPARFREFMSDYAGPGKLFTGATLWRAEGSNAVAVATTDDPVAADAQVQRSLVAVAEQSKTFVVKAFPARGSQRVAYAAASAGNPRYVLYAERAIPASRRVPVESTSAFADLHFATYLGPVATPAALQTTDVSDGQLPLRGDTAREMIPFGNTDLLLVTSAKTHLGGTFGKILPLMFLAGGLLLTIAAALAGGQLARRRTGAELDANTITALYDQLDDLYVQQRSISETLQRALLPKSNPEIASLDIASRYVAGTRGVDIGGDWYSLIGLDGDRFGFVVGDVSGRGVDAAALMARIRFTLRAYLIEGHPPEVALALCSRQVDILADGHMATVIVGVGDLVTGQATLANAGHLPPLTVDGDVRRFVSTKVGPPLGVSAGTYAPTTVTLSAGATLIAFTDGLVERRGEDLTVGLKRLSEAVPSPITSLDDTLTQLLDEMVGSDAEDDVAILAFTWRGPART
jgi:serine phosphatase RsbU (regulator of sigma subunit)